MNSFSVLFKKDFKDYLFTKGKGEKRDPLSSIFTIIILAIIIGGFIFIALSIVKSYLTLSLDGDKNPYLRSAELMNILYLFLAIFLTLYLLEKERKIIFDSKDKAIILRLPIKSSTIFISKFLITYLLSLITTTVFILPVNIIFYSVIGKFNVFYIFGSLINILSFSLLPFLIANALLVPYVKILAFFKNKQLLTLLFFVLVIAGGFYLYSLLLDVFRTLLENGNIRFLFNTDNMRIIHNIYEYSYPINFFVNISLGINLLPSYLFILLVIVISLVGAYILSKILFYHTLYSNNNPKEKVYHGKIKCLNPFISLIKKEFILTYRDNANLFSYFAIALAMPLMVFACFTLFKDLLYNAIGLEIDFVLGLFLLFVFIVLTNTYAASNITRDGIAFLKSKGFPYKPNKLLFAKVVFALLVSSIVIIVSGIILITVSKMNILEGIVLILCGIIFSLSQILLGTKFDLNKTNLLANDYEISKNQDKTITKLVFSGLILSLILGVSLLFISILLPTVISNNIVEIITLITTLLVTIFYFIYTICFYLYKLDSRFINLTL